MDKRNDLSNFEKDQIVTTGRTSAALLGCSRSAVVIKLIALLQLDTNAIIVTFLGQLNRKLKEQLVFQNLQTCCCSG